MNTTSNENLLVWNVVAVIHKLQKMRHLESVELNNSCMCGLSICIANIQEAVTTILPLRGVTISTILGN